MLGIAFPFNGHSYSVPKDFHADFHKDHLRKNVQRMRQIQKKAKEREIESAQPMKALWKSEKYTNIQSKIKEDIEKDPDAPRPHSAHFLRAHTRAGPPVKLQTRPITPDPKLSVPPASIANDVKLVRHDFDFIKINGRAVKHAHMVRSPSLTALDDIKKKQEEEFKKHKKGAVPDYLRSRKEQWKKDEEERIANMPDPSCPEGHRVMPDAERKETLELIKKKQEDLINKLQSLPLRTDTFRMRTCKQELENKIAEMEEAIKIFTRPKVFVKIIKG